MVSDKIRVLYASGAHGYDEVEGGALERQDRRFEVHSESSIEGALDHLETSRVNCVVSDFELTDGDAMRLLELVRRRKGDVPFVLYTADGDEELASRAIGAGVDDYVVRRPEHSGVQNLAERIRRLTINQPDGPRTTTDVEGGPPSRMGSERRPPGDSAYRQMLENLDSAVYMTDGRFEDIVYINSTYESLFGLPRDKLYKDSTSYREVVHPDDVDAIVECVQRAQAALNDDDVSLQVYSVTYRICHPDGDVRWVKEKMYPLYGSDGSVVGWTGVISDITEQQNREEVLEATAKKYEYILQNLDSVVWLSSEDYEDVLFINSAYEDIYERHPHQLEDDADDFLNAVHPDDYQRVYRGAMDVYEKANDPEATVPDMYEDEFRLLVDGEVKWIKEKTFPVRNEAGELIRFAGIEIDITEQKQHKQELEQLNERLQFQNRALSVMNRVFRHDLRNQLTVIKGASAAITGAPGDDELVDAVTEAAELMLQKAEQARQIDKLSEAYDQQMSAGIAEKAEHWVANVRREYPEADLSVEIEERTPVITHPLVDLALENIIENAIEHNDREVPHAEVRVGRTRLNGQPAVEVCIADDGPGIPEREREVLGQERESQLEHSLGLGLWLTKWVMELSGGRLELTDREPRGTVVRLVFPVADGDEGVDSTDWSSEETGGDVGISVGDGEAVDTIAEDDAENPTGPMGTDPGPLEIELEQYRTMLDTVPDGVLLLGTQGRVLQANREWASLLGYDRHEILGRQLSQLLDDAAVDESIAEKYDDVLRQLLSSSNGADTGTFTAQATPPGDTTPHTYEVHIGVIRGAGEYTGTVVVVHDVTEERERHSKLEQRQDRIDAFVSTVSHDLRNPLSVAMATTELIRHDVEHDALDNLDESLDRIESIIEEGLTMARLGWAVEGVSTVGLEELARRTWTQVETGSAELETESGVPVYVDSNQTRQLLENLFRNAVEHGSTCREKSSHDAVEHGSTSPASQARQDAVEHGSTGEGTGALTVRVGTLPEADGFYVEDTGCGIPESSREDVLEVGYSTSTDGTGFGLEIVQRIAESHGWELRIDESAEGGARFEFTGVRYAD